MKNIKSIIGSVNLVLHKYSPEILTGAGIVGGIATTIIACKATLKCDEILAEHEVKMENLQRAIDLAKEYRENYPPEEIRKDRMVIKVQTAADFVLLYGPAASLGMASIACILGGHHVMKKRNIALMAAYKVVEEAFSNYRKRVVGELGEAMDHHFKYGTDISEEEETIIDEKTGKKKKVKKEKETLTDAANAMYARVFEADRPDQMGSWYGSTQWCKVHDYNLQFLENKMQHFNDELGTKGFVTLNTVFDQLGFPRTESGMVIGWRDKGHGDNYISFRPKNDDSWVFGRDGDPILLEFNVDGVIFDAETALIEAK